MKEGMKAAEFEAHSISLSNIDEMQAVLADRFFELHELLDDRLESGFAIRVGQEMKMEDYGVLGLSWRTCSWAGEIFARSERYFKLLSNTYVFKVEKERELSHVYLIREAYRRGVALSNEATFSATVVVLQAMTEKNIKPVSVSFKHDPPKDLKYHKEAFDCPILFNQAANMMTYKSSDLEMRTAKADQSINAYLLERVEEELKGVEVNTNKVVTDIEALIKDALPSGIPSINQLGKHIGMSSRTLTRRLSENGTTFRALVKKTQQETATHLLSTPSKSISDIAFLTGFSEQSAFNRAFKRWTGKSPTEYRRMS